MKQLLNKFLPQDIIAIIVITGGLILKFSGADGIVGMILTTVVLFYFGKKEIVDRIITNKLPDTKFETPEQIIRRVTRDEGIDFDLAIRVAKCESGLNPGAIGRNSDGSLDRGLFQWNTRWHPEITDEVAFDAEKSTRAFCQAVKDGNIKWWSASKKCWNI